LFFSVLLCVILVSLWRILSPRRGTRRASLFIEYYRGEFPMAIEVPVASTVPTADSNNESVTRLVSGIITDAQVLIRQQADMFKAEMREEVHRSKRAAEFGAVGIICLIVGVLALIVALVFLLHEQAGFAMWASCGIIGIAFSVVGLLCGGFSYNLLERINPMPDKTIHALQENLTWQTK